MEQIAFSCLRSQTPKSLPADSASPIPHSSLWLPDLQAWQTLTFRISSTEATRIGLTSQCNVSERRADETWMYNLIAKSHEDDRKNLN